MTGSPPSARAQIPSALAATKPSQPDAFRPVPLTSAHDTSSGGPSAEAGPSHHDYTENAPQAVVDAIAIERAREEKEAPPDMMVGSFQSWAGQDGACRSYPDPQIALCLPDSIDQGIYPSSVTRTQLRPGSRRASIASRRSGSFGPRGSSSFMRPTPSQLDLQTGMQSPQSGVFYVDSEDDAPGPSSRGPYSPAARSHHKSGSRRRSRAQSNAQGSGGYFGYRPEHASNSQAGSPEALISPVAASPHRPSTAFGKIASYIGFRQGQDEDEEAHPHGLRRNRERSGSYTSSRGESASLRSTSEESWGYNDDDTDDESDRPSGEEGYTSSLADDTSLPPQSRPGSPHLPLIPASSDAVFGETGRGAEEEVKDFASVAIPSRQTILLPDEDLSIRFTGYRTDPFRNTLWWIGCILSLGILGLVGRWIPSVWVRFCGKENSFDEAKEGSWIVVEVRQYCRSGLPLTSRRLMEIST